MTWRLSLKCIHRKNLNIVRLSFSLPRTLQGDHRQIEGSDIIEKIELNKALIILRESYPKMLDRDMVRAVYGKMEIHRTDK